MAKRYGLIEKKSQQPTRLAAFMSESEDSDEGPKNKRPTIELGDAQKRQAKLAQQKAMEEDPTIYQYDELYDEIENKRKEAKVDKSKMERKPKYINKLLEMADKRKKENERRVERQVQKEREEEGEKFKDKESFVTSAYRQKLEEMRKAEELEKREEYLESIGDVTKQKNLDGFYRHIYSQKLDQDEKVPAKPEEKSEETTEPSSSKSNKSQDNRIKKERKYRKHHSEDDEEEKSDSEAKKVHLQSNLDADSDFSIDSDSDSEGSQPSKDEKSKENDIKTEPQSPETLKTDSAKENLKLEVKIKSEEKEKVVEPKKPKIDIWKKRTVGEAYEAAVRRYYERKATRETGL